MRLVRTVFLTALLGSVWIFSEPASAQGLIQGRSLGMANAFTSIARGVYAPGWNPANLALDGNPGFDFNLVGVGIRVGNSTLSKHFYDLYNGKTLNEKDKSDILNRVPDNGLRFLMDTQLQALGVAYKSFAFTVSGFAGTNIAIDKDYLDIVLHGIDMNRKYSLGDNQGGSLSYSKIAFSAAHRFSVPFVDFVAVGVNAGYLVGIGVAEIRQMQAEFYNSYDGYADGKLLARYALLGRGFSLDLGVATVYKNWNVGLAVSNMLGSIKWTGERKAHWESFRTLVNLNVFSVSQTSDGDSIVQRDSSDYTPPPFSTRLPVEMRIGASRTWRSFLFAVDYHQGFANRPGVSPKPYLAVGGEWHGIGFLPLRFGLGLGGYYGISPAMGFGLHAGFFKFDLGWMFRGGLLPSYAKGVSLGMNLNFRF
ncbi:hypothetical protein BMS3Abin05_00118 [bacterium BMS3Abin05]|nr:hypothetical protein BMS3Abin05_00118 [bacterium BMS3Abin05]GBE26306.1 hypothetical protein BMS3Bbin03_00218 [bacterium BMS3Bbin03]HDZ11415.1 hypothetical protein [Bacteroidota bacterium]